MEEVSPNLGMNQELSQTTRENTRNLQFPRHERDQNNPLFCSPLSTLQSSMRIAIAYTLQFPTLVYDDRPHRKKNTRQYLSIPPVRQSGSNEVSSDAHGDRQ